jgi:hypothetical protein
VLIFSEGKCINEWHFRPLKKGTARLAISSWLDGIPLRILPVGINYNSFRKFGKNIHMYFGEFITEKDVDLNEGSASQYKLLIQIFKSIISFCYEIDKTDKATLFSKFYLHNQFGKRYCFPTLPAGWILHAPLYYPLKKTVLKKTNSTDHYDSLIVALLFLAYRCILAF